MENDPLSRLLGDYAREDVPPPPGDLESRVWREVRARRARPASLAERLAALLTGSLRWTPACAAVAVALLIGVVMGHAGSGAVPDPLDPSGDRTGDSLGLSVFSAEPPAMPSTLLSRRP